MVDLNLNQQNQYADKKHSEAVPDILWGRENFRGRGAGEKGQLYRVFTELRPKVNTFLW